MKKGQILALALAGTCGLGAIWFASKLSKTPPPVVAAPELTNMIKVLVARTDIGLGTLTSESHFRWQEYPEAAVPVDVIRCTGTTACPLSQYGNSIARVPILKEEIITKLKLVKVGEGGVLASILPQGMRAISTKIQEDSAVGHLILPNDHVDVILIRRMRARGGQEEHVSDTLFRNVKVLAIGQRIEAAKAADQKGVEAKTATLELSPRQTELLALAKSMGEISLALRSIADFKEDKTTKDLQTDNRGSAIRLLRYGVKSRAHGVN